MISERESLPPRQRLSETEVDKAVGPSAVTTGSVASSLNMAAPSAQNHCIGLPHHKIQITCALKFYDPFNTSA